MNGPISKLARCAIYTRKSTEYNLELAFNSHDAQREACEAYIQSQAHEGWRLIPGRYDDGAFSGASLDRPALQQLLAEVRAGKIDIVLVYKVDRLTRSLTDFAKLIELFDAHGVSFVSVTQSFNTSSSMGRLTLNVLLSFAQFERELIGERVRDKIAASKRKGLWVGGPVPLGYTAVDKKILVVAAEAEAVRTIFARYLERVTLTPNHLELRPRELFEPMHAHDPVNDGSSGPPIANVTTITVPWSSPVPVAVKGIIHVPAHNTPIKASRREALLIAIAKARHGSTIWRMVAPPVSP